MCFKTISAILLFLSNVTANYNQFAFQPMELYEKARSGYTDSIWHNSIKITFSTHTLPLCPSVSFAPCFSVYISLEAQRHNGSKTSSLQLEGKQQPTHLYLILNHFWVVLHIQVDLFTTLLKNISENTCKLILAFGLAHGNPISSQDIFQTLSGVFTFCPQCTYSMIHCLLSN